MDRTATPLQIATVLVMLCAAHLTAADPLPIPQVRLPLMDKPPTVDGTVSEAEWRGAARMQRMGWDGLLSGGEVDYRVGSDGKTLFIAVVSETAPGGKLLTRAEVLPPPDDARTYIDDSVELALDPLPHDTTDRRLIYAAIFNSRKAIGDWAFKPDGGGVAWRGNWQLGSSVKDDRWTMEIAIPLKDMQVKPEDIGKPMGVRICRNWHLTVGRKQTEWGSVAGAFNNPKTMPQVIFDPAAPVVQHTQLTDAARTRVDLKLDIVNPHKQPMTVHVVLDNVPENSAHGRKDVKLTIAPGAAETVRFTPPSTPDETMTTTLRVASADDKTVYYRRGFTWTVRRPEPFFEVDADADKRVAVLFAHYPYHKTMRLKVDVSGLAARDKVTGVSAEIRPDGPGEALATTELPKLDNYAATMLWQVPDLPDGKYKLVVRLQGVKVDPVEETFVRHRFEWERNTLGKSDIVVPPFTPIRVKDGTVSTILREHRTGSLGLWDQVTADGVALLAGPMKLQHTNFSVLDEARGRNVKVLHSSDTRIVTSAQFEAGPVTGTVLSEWDVDGMMKWTLTLDPTDKPVGWVRLTVPIKNDLAPLFNTCTDGIRFNYAGATPAGEGVVWDGSKAARRSLLGSYVPYIWLGDERRGLAVFGDNDSGWITDEKIPCQELIRQGKQLKLVLNLKSTIGPIKDRRTIVIGFQATPVKPMPENWRRWTLNWKGRAIDRMTRKFSFLGSCWSWGALTPCLDIYPHKQDFAIWEQFAETRRTGKVDRAFIDRWVAAFEPTVKEMYPDSPEQRDKLMHQLRVHTRSGFHTFSGKPELTIFYTNARGMRYDTPQAQTFLDEWNREAFSGRRWGVGQGKAYDSDPVESFRDYHLWYYKKAIDLGVLDSVYWDDVFLQSTWDVVGTAAYVRPDGRIQPSAGLFSMREFVRRTAVLFAECGKPNLNMCHMTNTPMVPILSFARINYSWEDKGGVDDFQDRFSRDYIRAESIGRQTGNLPGVMGLVRGGTPEQQARAIRTGVGVVLVHELTLQANWDEYWSIYRKMLEFGYGTDGVTVWPYWNDAQPVTVHGGDAVALVASKPRSCIIVLTDYDKGADYRLELDNKTLRLPGPVKAVNLETGKPMQVTDDGQVIVPLKKHDFAVIRIDS